MAFGIRDRHRRCDLTRTELLGAIRCTAPDRLVDARTVLQGVALLRVSTAIFEDAGRLDPTDLRSLDTVHLASARDLGDDLEGLVTYDRRSTSAARANGIQVLAPTRT